MNAPQEESFISHLVELRDRLLRAVVAVVLVFVCLMPWAGDIYDLLALPMMANLPEGTRMIATGVVTPFFVPVKVTLLVAFVIALPFVLYQAWAFIAPGLYAHEKRLGLPLVIGSEGRGVSASLEGAAHDLTIPTAGVESLFATAGASPSRTSWPTWGPVLPRFTRLIASMGTAPMHRRTADGPRAKNRPRIPRAVVSSASTAWS